MALIIIIGIYTFSFLLLHLLSCIYARILLDILIQSCTPLLEVFSSLPSSIWSSALLFSSLPCFSLALLESEQLQDKYAWFHKYPNTTDAKCIVLLNTPFFPKYYNTQLSTYHSFRFTSNYADCMSYQCVLKPTGIWP